jgi:archaellin
MINTTLVFGGLEPQDTIVLRIIPKHGQTTRGEVTMPDAYMGEIVDIY